MLVITGIGHATPVQWSTAIGGNGNYYEIIQTSGGISWDTANTLANASYYLGIQGHLTTITSSEENLFISNDPGLGNGISKGIIESKWLGGYQLPGSTEPDGGWQWVTGEAFAYANWASGEPNDSPVGENRITFQHGWNSDGKEWNDLTDSWFQGGYVIEYEASSVPIPEPATMLLLGSGLIGLTGFRRKFKK